jgi:glycerol-1-phosphate dehydrogenase [NAD(P)+]
VAASLGLETEPFTKSRVMNFPRTVLAGHGVLTELGRVCARLGYGGSAALITGPRTRGIAGDRAGEVLKLQGFGPQLVLGEEATLEESQRLTEEIRSKHCGFVVGVGGGSKIDLAKVVAANLHVPFVSVPTAASHDGISSPRASLRGSREAFSVEAAVPDAIVADTSILMGAPYRSLAAGCADVISNLTAVLDWRLASRVKNEEFSSTGAALAEYAANEILEHAATIRKGTEESVWLAIRPIIMSGIAMSIAGTSRPSSGSEHLFAHALERIAPGRALHGEMVGVGTIMMAYLHGIDWKRLRDALQAMGAPVTAEELSVNRSDIVAALVNAHSLRPERYTILGDRGLAPEAAEKLAVTTGVA